jgi:hypothetical protein
MPCGRIYGPCSASWLSQQCFSLTPNQHQQQPLVFFSHNESAPAISRLPAERGDERGEDGRVTCLGPAMNSGDVPINAGPCFRKPRVYRGRLVACMSQPASHRLRQALHGQAAVMQLLGVWLPGWVHHGWAKKLIGCLDAGAGLAPLLSHLMQLARPACIALAWPNRYARFLRFFGAWLQGESCMKGAWSNRYVNQTDCCSRMRRAWPRADAGNQTPP